MQYEAAGKARKVCKAQKLWFAILESQVETGTPYMMYKDACNRKSNQQNLGTIKSSNLCAPSPRTQLYSSSPVGTVFVIDAACHVARCLPAAADTAAARSLMCGRGESRDY